MRAVRLPLTRSALVTAVLAVGLAVVLGAGPAFAYWSVAGTGNASAKAEALTVPDAPTVGSATPSTLTVNGTFPKTQLSGASYTVLRGSTLVCSPNASPFSCTDSGLTENTSYSYVVVASLGAWTASSTATSGTTTCADRLRVSAPANATAGTPFWVRLTAVTTCAQSTDTSVTGTQKVSWSAPPSSPSGTSAKTPDTADFVDGVATVAVTLYGAGTTTLTATAVERTGTSASITVAAGSAANVQLSSVTSNNIAVTLTCGPLTDPASARSCSASDPGVATSHAWRAVPGVWDTWGNPSPVAADLVLTVNSDDGNGVTSTTTSTIPSGASTGPSFSVFIGRGGTVSITVSGSGLATLTVTDAK